MDITESDVRSLTLGSLFIIRPSFLIFNHNPIGHDCSPPPDAMWLSLIMMSCSLWASSSSSSSSRQRGGEGEKKDKNETRQRDRNNNITMPPQCGSFFSRCESSQIKGACIQLASSQLKQSSATPKKLLF